MIRNCKLLILCITVIYGFVCLGGCANAAGSDMPVTRTGFFFDTVVSITVYDKSKSGVIDKCFELCEKYENLFSASADGSDVWNINHSGGKPVPVSYETALLIQSALFYCAETGGLLDLTLLPITKEWDIAGQMARASENPDYEYYIPSSDRLAELLKHVGCQNVALYDESGAKASYTDRLSRDTDYRVALLDAQGAIDLGFIAKGFIADTLKEYMLSEGVGSGIISLGGNVLLIGAKPDGSPFRVGIQKPFGSRNEIITAVEQTDKSVVSSGCYERYFISGQDKKDGALYHHIFDTTTGCPVQNDLFEVTIISDSSLLGDALSTYCYILGLDRGLAYIRSLDGVDAVFVTADYEVIHSY